VQDAVNLRAGQCFAHLRLRFPALHIALLSSIQQGGDGPVARGVGLEGPLAGIQV
jgi:hypothetical protein